MDSEKEIMKKIKKKKKKIKDNYLKLSFLKLCIFFN